MLICPENFGGIAKHVNYRRKLNFVPELQKRPIQSLNYPNRPNFVSTLMSFRRSLLSRAALAFRPARSVPVAPPVGSAAPRHGHGGA
jgi:hypothetical protein